MIQGLAEFCTVMVIFTLNDETFCHTDSREYDIDNITIYISSK